MSDATTLLEYLQIVAPVFFMGIGVGLIAAVFIPSPRRRRWRDSKSRRVDVTRLPSIIIKD